MRNKFIVIILVFFVADYTYSQEYLPGDNELLFMPTAYTMPENNSYFSDYELFLLNYSYAVTPTTHISILSIFPIVPAFYETITIGFKQKVIKYESFQSAFYGVYNPKSGTYSIGNVVSLGFEKSSFHFSTAYYTYDEDGNGDWVYMLGMKYSATRASSIIIEYENTKSFVTNEFQGIISIGVRLRSTHMSWELAGVRPLTSSTNLLFFPLLKAGYYFN